MKNLKNNAMALVALAIAGTSVTLMSFKQTQTEVSLHWFEVDANGNISPTSTGSPTSSCPNIPPAQYCEVAFETETPPVTNMEETELESGTQPVADIRYKLP